MFWVLEEWGQSDQGRGVLGMVWFPEASGKLAMSKPGTGRNSAKDSKVLTINETIVLKNIHLPHFSLPTSQLTPHKPTHPVDPASTPSSCQAVDSMKEDRENYDMLGHPWTF